MVSSSTESPRFSVTSAGVDPSRSSITATPFSVTPGETTIVSVTARDDLGNPISGAAVQLTGGPDGTFTQPPVTDANGVASGSYRSDTPGAKTIAARSGESPSTTKSPSLWRTHPFSPSR